MAVFDDGMGIFVANIDDGIRSSEIPIENDIFSAFGSDEGQNHLPRLPHTPKMYLLLL